MIDDMKKILITLCMVLCLAPAAWASNQSGKLRTLVNEYRDEPGVEVVDLGGLGMGLLRMAARAEAARLKVIDLIKELETKEK